jgi:hypothetical protein
VDSLRAQVPRRIVGLQVVLLMVAVTAGGGLALAFGLPGAGAKGYSAYHDPQKPVLSFLLSDERNVEEFQREFGLSDEKVREALAVVREEDDAFSREYDESEGLVEANKGATKTEVRNKIAASDFDEKTKLAVANTKSKIENLLPTGRADDLGAWVDEQWEAESAEYAAASEATFRVSSRGYSCRLWMSYYRGNTRYEVALPHQKIKFRGGRRVRITDVRKGTSARAPVRETGPWNTRDDYWRTRLDRSMWNDLPRCLPQAEAAFFDNYNRGKDQFGREVGNPAGVDITPAVARRMDVWRKMQRLGLIRVRVHFPWVRG